MTVIDPSWELTGKMSCHSKIEEVLGRNRGSKALFLPLEVGGAIPSERSAPPSTRPSWRLSGRLPCFLMLKEQHAELVAGASALVSLYGDEATTPCLEYAAVSGTPCALVPCNECAGAPIHGSGAMGCEVRFFPAAPRGITRRMRRRCFCRRRREVVGLDSISKDEVFSGSSVRCCNGPPFSKVLLVQLPESPEGQRTRQQLELWQAQMMNWQQNWQQCQQAQHQMPQMPQMPQPRCRAQMQLQVEPQSLPPCT